MGYASRWVSRSLNPTYSAILPIKQIEYNDKYAIPRVDEP